MKLLFVFCEGPHDAQFLGRMLKESDQYAEFKKPIKDYPFPLNGYLNKKFKNRNIDEIRIGKTDNSIVPACAYCNIEQDSLILPISTGGMDKILESIALLEEIKNSFAPDILAYSEQGVENLSILFLYDADSRGVEATATLFNQRFAECFPAGTTISPNLWANLNGYSLGLFIFTGTDGNTGTLEDNIVELFRNSDANLFQDAESFVNNKFELITAGSDQLAHETKKKKGMLTACGQAERKNAGYSLTVVVRDSKLLNGAFNFEDNTAQWTKLLRLINGVFE